MDKINAIITLEILGRPPKNVTDSLSALIKRLGKEDGVSVLNSKIHEPKPVPESNDLHTSFAEVELEFDGLHNYFGVVFGYMPSHIELIHPERITLGNHDLNALANQIIQRLHSYDAIAKQMIAEKDMILAKLKEVAPHLFKQEEKAEEPKLKKKATKKKAVKNSKKLKKVSKKTTKKAKKK